MDENIKKFVRLVEELHLAKQQRDDLLTACEELLKAYDPYDVDERFLEERLRIEKQAEVAIAKALK